MDAALELRANASRAVERRRSKGSRALPAALGGVEDAAREPAACGGGAARDRRRHRPATARRRSQRSGPSATPVRLRGSRSTRPTTTRPSCSGGSPRHSKASDRPTAPPLPLAGRRTGRRNCRGSQPGWARPGTSSSWSTTLTCSAPATRPRRSRPWPTTFRRDPRWRSWAASRPAFRSRGFARAEAARAAGGRPGAEPARERRAPPRAGRRAHGRRGRRTARALRGLGGGHPPRRARSPQSSRRGFSATQFRAGTIASWRSTFAPSSSRRSRPSCSRSSGGRRCSNS